MTTTADQPDINRLTAVNLATVHNFQLALLIIYIYEILIRWMFPEQVQQDQLIKYLLYNFHTKITW